MSAIAKRSDPQINIRLPRDLVKKLEASARKNGRSRNTEIIFLLRSASERTQEVSA